MISVPLPILDIMLNNNGTAFAQGAAQKRYHLVLRADRSGALEPLGHGHGVSLDVKRSRSPHAVRNG
jgi:hypothetical protein